MQFLFLKITCRAALNAPQCAQQTTTATSSTANLNESLFLCFSLRQSPKFSLSSSCIFRFFFVVVVVDFARDKKGKDKTNRGKTRRNVIMRSHETKKVGSMHQIINQQVVSQSPSLSPSTTFAKFEKKFSFIFVCFEWFC